QLNNKDALELFFFGSGDFVSQIQHTYDTNDKPVDRKDTVVDVQFHRVDMRWDHGIERGNWRNAIMLGLDQTLASNEPIKLTNHMLGYRSEFHQVQRPGLEARAGLDLLYERLAQDATENGQNDFGTGDQQPAPGANPMQPGGDPTQPPIDQQMQDQSRT